MATRWSSHRPACSIRYRTLHVSSSANDSFKKFMGACSRRPHHSHFSHGRQNRRSSFCRCRTVREEVKILVTIVRFVKPLFANMHHRVHAVAGPCGSQTLHAAPRCLHWMASVMVMCSTLSSHSADATFRRPNGSFFICTLH